MQRQRGRKSAASLEIVPPAELPRPEPPENMSPEARAVWTEILDTHHHSQFASGLHLLEIFCVSVVLERRAARAVEELPPGKQRDAAARERRDEAAMIARLATKLRLSPRSHFDRYARPKTVTPGPKPWDRQ